MRWRRGLLPLLHTSASVGVRRKRTSTNFALDTASTRKADKHGGVDGPTVAAAVAAVHAAAAGAVASGVQETSPTNPLPRRTSVRVGFAVAEPMDEDGGRRSGSGAGKGGGGTPLSLGVSRAASSSGANVLLSRFALYQQGAAAAAAAAAAAGESNPGSPSWRRAVSGFASRPVSRSVSRRRRDSQSGSSNRMAGDGSGGGGGATPVSDAPANFARISPFAAAAALGDEDPAAVPDAAEALVSAGVPTDGRVFVAGSPQPPKYGRAAHPPAAERHQSGPAPLPSGHHHPAGHGGGARAAAQAAAQGQGRPSRSGPLPNGSTVMGLAGDLVARPADQQGPGVRHPHVAALRLAAAAGAGGDAASAARSKSLPGANVLPPSATAAAAAAAAPVGSRLTAPGAVAAAAVASPQQLQPLAVAPFPAPLSVSTSAAAPSTPTTAPSSARSSSPSIASRLAAFLGKLAPRRRKAQVAPAR